MSKAISTETAAYSVALTQAGKAIVAHLDKADKTLGKYQDHMDTAGVHLVDARSACKQDKVSFTKWLKDMGIGKTRAYQVLKVADGTMTQEELLAKNAAAMRAYKAKLKAEVKEAREEKAAKPAKAAASVLESAGLDVADFVDFIAHAFESKDAKEAKKVVATELKSICAEFNIPC